MSIRLIVYSLLFLLAPCLVQAQSRDQLSTLLEARGPEIMREARLSGDLQSQAVYTRFAQLVARELEQTGDKETASRIVATLNRANGKDIPKQAFAWITHTFAREFYKDDIINATSDLIKFKTFATDVPNQQNPEFIKQKDYLRKLAQKLGLHFNDVDGYIQEIWIGDGEETFGIMVHSDVQPVDESEWHRDPWSGAIVDGTIWGRGAVDDKGPLAAIMYGMRARLDCGLPLQKKIILLVGTDEESANKDVSTYLQTHDAPDQTIVVDSNYPVICAEKGWCGFWLKLPRTSGTPEGVGLLLTDLQSGFSVSIVPAVATATLRPIRIPPSEAKAKLQAQIDDFVQQRNGAELSVTERDGELLLTASGKSVHSSRPATGHNALMDLLVFLDRDVRPLKNNLARMAKFAATYVGFELHGKSLGISHHDDFMGDVTVAANLFQTKEDTLTFFINARIPKGIEHGQLLQELDRRIAEFDRTHGVKIVYSKYLSTPLYNDPTSQFVTRLLGIYNTVTGEQRIAESTGGGTYAKRIPNAVVFGPALPDEDYLGHQPDEHIQLSTLIRNIEILTHTIVEFSM